MREDFQSVDHFYAANPERDRSREVDYGVMWTDGGLNWPHYRVSWVESTGEFYAVRLSAGRGGPVEVLGFAEDDKAAEAALDGWAELAVLRLAWVRSRLRSARVYATLTIEVWFHEESEPLSQAEVERLASSTSNWGDWNLVSVGPISKESKQRGGLWR